MRERSGVLHWQEGEGLDMLQFPLRKMSAIDGSTGGVAHSEPREEQGKFLEKGKFHRCWVHEKKHTFSRALTVSDLPSCSGSRTPAS